MVIYPSAMASTVVKERLEGLGGDKGGELRCVGCSSYSTTYLCGGLGALLEAGVRERGRRH